MRLIKKLLPVFILNKIRPPYHFFLAVLGALIYRFPSGKIKIVAVTGTKGKSTVTEIVNAILEETGFKTAVANTLRFKVGEKHQRNFFKMTMPGRFFMQKFLREAVSAKCEWAVIEMTSEGVKQFRHKFINLDSLIFTNLSPEHIEAHGSYENYVKAKLKIAESLGRSSKKRKVLVINNDDKEAEKFKAVQNTEKVLFSIRDAKNLNFETKLIGEFNVYNILSALAFAKAFDIDLEKAKEAVKKLEKIRGRVEEISAKDFKVYVDYAHTPDSLEKLYKAFENSRKICVLGNTGGGRDKWKRPEMGKIADKYCEKVILTNEDPYDEDPRRIIDEMAKTVSKEKLEIIMDRKEAIKKALYTAKELKDKNLVVLITGKGTDPFIMGPKGSKIPWDDAEVVKEELEKI